MIQHHSCLYCGKEFKTPSLACGCPESRPMIVYKNHHSLDFRKPEMTPLQRQDLIFLAKELPKVPNIDHEKIILRNFEQGGWENVNKYILFVHELHFALYPKESRRAFVTRKWIHYTTKMRSWLLHALNYVKQLEIR